VVNAEQISGILPLLLIVVVFWFLVLRPARRRQRDAAELQQRLALGDKVMLTSGIFGVVRALDDESLEVEAAPGVLLTVHRQAIAKIVPPDNGGSEGQLGGGSTASDPGDDPRS